MASQTETTFDRHERRISPAAIDHALAGASHTPYWLDNDRRPAAAGALNTEIQADLLIVGGGYTGLWTALQAKERDPGRNVVLLEAQRIGWAASGRNGGFCEASLVHGESNGQAHLPTENARLTELGFANLAELIDTIKRYSMDVDLVEQGVLSVATEAHQVAWLREEAHEHAQVDFLDAAATRAMIDSPDFLAGSWDRTGTVLVHPAKLAWELARVCRELGVRIFEHSRAEDLTESSGRLRVGTAAGAVYAARVALATNAFPSLLARHRLHTIPVYDYALMTEPLTAQQREALGWEKLTGLADLNNRFHYARPTLDEQGNFRILYGGYDALYHFGGRVRSRYDTNPATFRKLAAHFLGSFPQLSEVRFSHAWGGAIDTCSRFFAFFDTAYDGRVAYCAGFTGLGVGATRFGAKVMLDLLSGERTELTQLQMVRDKPLPFPPEPAAWLGVKLMTHELIRADRNQGRRSAFLKAMDALGMGFDS